MKRNFFIATLTIIMNIMNIFSSDGQSYNELWNNVSDLKQKDMPRKVIDEAQKIYDKAQKEKNFPHLAKAWITIVETKCDLDPDSFRIANFPPFPHKGLVEDAVYNAVMGSAYLAMADSHISDFVLQVIVRGFKFLCLLLTKQLGDFVILCPDMRGRSVFLSHNI